MSQLFRSAGGFREQIERIRSGLPVQHALSLMEEWDIPILAFARLLGVSDRSMSRLRSGNPEQLLSTVETDRLMRVESLLDKAKFVLDDAATLWLHSPVKALDDQTPLSLMDTDVGCSEVDLVLGTAVGLAVTTLATEATDFAHGHAEDAGGPQRFLHLFESVRLDDGGDQMLMIFAPRELVTQRPSAADSNRAAKSAIGMAEMLAHEIKNPLAGITGAAQFLAMTLPPQDLEMTDLIVAESRRIVQLLEQVEQFGNVLPPKRSAVNIHDVLDRARQSASVGFGAHMMMIEDYDPSLPAAFVDGDQLLQVLLNLLKNASEAGQQGGTITLRTFYDTSLRIQREDGGAAHLPLQIEIIDDGAGLPPEIANDVFEPFISGKENGTGLGLALVSKLVTDVGGWIAVTSAPGRTVFRISLPLVPADVIGDV